MVVPRTNLLLMSFLRKSKYFSKTTAKAKEGYVLKMTMERSLSSIQSLGSTTATSKFLKKWWKESRICGKLVVLPTTLLLKISKKYGAEFTL